MLSNTSGRQPLCHECTNFEMLTSWLNGHIQFCHGLPESSPVSQVPCVVTVIGLLMCSYKLFIEFLFFSDCRIRIFPEVAQFSKYIIQDSVHQWITSLLRKLTFGCLMFHKKCTYIFQRTEQRFKNDFISKLCFLKMCLLFYYSLFDLIFFLFQYYVFQFFLLGTHTGRHVRTSRTVPTL